MKGLVKYGLGKEGMEIRELPIPEPGRGQIRAKVVAAGVCGSDIHFMRDEMKVNMPVVLGHEYVGIVDKTGEGVTRFRQGDYITSMTAYSSCGTCRFCQEGAPIFCLEKKMLGNDVNGTMAEYVIVPELHSYKVPDSIENKINIAALEPFGCGLRAAAERTVIKPGDIVVVSGPGTLGLSVVQVAKLRGAYVIAFGLPQDGHRLALAKKLGADDTATDPAELRKKVFEKSAYGADICFEVAGVPASMNMCFDLVRRRGTITQLGLYNGFPAINMNAMTDNEINIVSSRGCQKTTFDLALRLLQEKKIDIECFVESKYKLEDWSEAFDTAASGKAFKVLLTP